MKPHHDVVPTGFHSQLLQSVFGGIHVVSGGVGDTAVLLIPGWPETWFACRHVMVGLATSYRVLAIDPPGLGESDPIEAYDTQAVARAIHDAIRPMTGQTIRVVGHDVGTWIAYAYATLYPMEVSHLALFDAGLPGVSSAQEFPLSWEANIKAWQFSFNALPELPEALTSGREEILFDWLITQKAMRPEAISKSDRAEYLRAYKQPGRMHAGFEYYRAVEKSAEQNRKAGETKLPMPVLAYGAENGVADGLRSALIKVATNVQGGVVAGSGHYIPEEAPEFVVAALRSFFSGENVESEASQTAVSA